MFKKLLKLKKELYATTLNSLFLTCIDCIVGSIACLLRCALVIGWRNALIYIMTTLTQHWRNPSGESDPNEQEDADHQAGVAAAEPAAAAAANDDLNQQQQQQQLPAGDDTDGDGGDYELDPDVLKHLSQQYGEDEYVEEEGENDDNESGGNHRDLTQQALPSTDEAESDDSDIDSSSAGPTGDATRNQNVAIDDYFQSPAAKKPRTHQKDTNQKVWLEIPGDNTQNKPLLKCFRRNEIFRSKKKIHQGKIFVIERLLWEGRMTKAAECRVYRRLKDTYVGSFAGDSFLADQDIGVKYVAYRMTQTIELRELDSRVPTIPNFPPKEVDTLVWHPNQKKTTGVGFKICYTVSKRKNDKARRESIPMKGMDIPIKCLELFAGAGGMSVGLERAGLDVCWAVENDVNAAATWRLNHPRKHDIMFSEDIKQFFANVKKGIRPYCEVKPNHIHGSPPCQGYSKANRNGGKDDEENKKMTDLFFDIVLYLEPDTVSMENVGNILHPEHEHYLERGIARLLKAGYQCALLHVDASSFGDPQARQRAILLAAKNTLLFCPNIEATHGDGEGLKPFVTPGDDGVLGALEDLEPSVGGMFRLSNGDLIYDHRIEGTTLPTNPKEIVDLKCSEPSKTLTKSNRFKHYEKDRSLTIRELARLQSFPDDHHFVGNVKCQRDQIGNAVPCKLAEAIGRAIVESYP